MHAYTTFAAYRCLFVQYCCCSKVRFFEILHSCECHIDSCTEFTYTKVKYNTKQNALFFDFLVMWTVAKTHQLLLSCVYHSQPLEQLQLLKYSKLQMAKTVVKASLVGVYNTYIPHDSQLCMGKYKLKQWRSEGRAWPGTCPPKAPCSCRSCHAISRERARARASVHWYWPGARQNQWPGYATELKHMYEYATRTGKLMQVYTEWKGIVSLSTVYIFDWTTVPSSCSYTALTDRQWWKNFHHHDNMKYTHI